MYVCSHVQILGSPLTNGPTQGRKHVEGQAGKYIIMDDALMLLAQNKANEAREFVGFELNDLVVVGIVGGHHWYLHDSLPSSRHGPCPAF